MSDNDVFFFKEKCSGYLWPCKHRNSGKTHRLKLGVESLQVLEHAHHALMHFVNGFQWSHHNLEFADLPVSLPE